MMETGTYAKRLACEIREACLESIRTNAISYQELSRLLGVPYRGAMTITQAKEWTLDRAVTVAEQIGMDVALYLDGAIPIGFQSPMPMQRKVVTWHHRVTMASQARKTIQFGSK
jgi:hypothetical protein